MTGMLTAWQRQTDPERVDTYTRWTIYLLLACAPLVTLCLPSAVGNPAAAAFVVLPLGRTAAAVGVVRGVRARLVSGRPLSRRWLAVLAGTTAAALGVAVVGLP